MPWGLLFILGYKKTVKGLGQSPDNPWAGCLTEILSCVVPFEKFSWCFRSENFRINISADLHGCSLSLCLFMLLVFLYGSDLHLKLTNPTYLLFYMLPQYHILRARRHHAFGVLAGTPAITNSSFRAFRAAKQPQQLASITFCLPQPSVAK